MRRVLPAIGALALALAGCASGDDAQVPRVTTSSPSMSSDDVVRAMWQCINVEWGYRVFETEDAARDHCEWLRVNNPREFGEYLDLYHEQWPRTDPAID